jgi:hypothetical protein
MTRTFAIRMDARKYDTVARLARRRGATVSEAVREALDAWIERARTEGAKAPYVALADLVGSVETRTTRQRARPTARRRTRSRR